AYAPELFSGYTSEFYSGNPASPNLLALHESFGSPVTVESPARPGEVVHLFGRGFGEVTPIPPYGSPAASSPLSRVTESLLCRIGDDPSAPRTEVLFAGLVPGSRGIYQLDIRLPTTLTDGVQRVTCVRSTMSLFE